MKPFYLLLAACGFLSAAGFLNAAGQEESKPANPAPAAAASAEPVTLDYQFFKQMVQPIYVRKRLGHARCFQCHADPRMRVMALAPLPHGVTTWTEEQSRKNFNAVKTVAYPGDLDSPLLLHPLATDAGGDDGHTGGKHFLTKDDPEWLTLKAFVMGAKLK